MQDPQETHALAKASAPDGQAADSPASPQDADGFNLQDLRALLRQTIRRFHSEVGTPLAAIGLQLELLKSSEHVDAGTRQTLDQIGRDLGDVIDSARQSLKELRRMEEWSNSAKDR